MEVNLIPVICDTPPILKFGFNKIQVGTKLYDFSELPNGSLRTSNDDIIKVVKTDESLNLTVVNYITEEMNLEKPFPETRSINGTDADLDEGLEKVEINWYSDEERQMDDILAKIQPSRQEIMEAEMEIQTITLLQELEVFSNE